MAKLSFLEALSIALFTSVFLWQATSSYSLGPYSSTVTEETLTTTKETPSSSSVPYLTTTTEETTTTGSTCGGVTCPPDKYCNRDWNVQPECVCITAYPLFTSSSGVVCTQIHAPVCGSDGKTYDNECMLRSKACWTNTSITVVHDGKCKTGCTGVECPFYGECVLDVYNRPICACFLGCDEIYDPVCGCNNQTYTSDCELRSDACQTNTSITVLHTGRCDGGSAWEMGNCHIITCPPGKNCSTVTQSQVKCICDISCTTEYAPVCASNGKTYGNRCEFSMTACQTKTIIAVVHDGECKTGN